MKYGKGGRLKNRQGLYIAKQLMYLQTVVVALLSFVTLLFVGRVSAQSVLLGGFVSVLPNVCFSRLLFRQQSARAARQIVKSFYRAEALKLTLSALLFMLVFSCFAITPIAFFVAYMASQSMVWIAPWIPTFK